MWPCGSAVDMGSHNKVCAPSDKVSVACVSEECGHLRYGVHVHWFASHASRSHLHCKFVICTGLVWFLLQFVAHAIRKKNLACMEC